VPYSPFFLTQVKDGNVASVASKGDTIEGTFKSAVSYPSSATPATAFTTQVPSFAEGDSLVALLQKQGVSITAKSESSGSSLIEDALFTFLPFILLIGFFLWAMNKASGSMGGLASFGKSRARRAEPSAQLVTFADVAGIDEAKDELSQIVDFLRDPTKYRRLGGRIPRGVLLTGSPGTGKTLLARALAGEAQVPFFSTSAAEFVEMIVGTGASRVRDLFNQAKGQAPAIIFIDELDAIGRSRSGVMSGMGGAHDEREQTLNQILTEMDGFDTSAGVIVVAATNRPEILDPALLRPGRFDRSIAVQSPDTPGRRKILDVHVRSVPLDEDVDLDTLAATTIGMVGADLANVINEGALLAAQRGHERVCMSDLHDALEKLVLGSERRILLSDEERKRTAYHEAGHAIVGMFTPGTDPVRKVSIIPRGMALGVTLSAPDADRFSYDRAFLMGKIKVALGGRAAEELVFEEVTTGAQNDLKQLTEIARRMVGAWGMSEAIGPVAVISEEGMDRHLVLPGQEPVSQDTMRVMDEEVKRLVEGAYVETVALLVEHRSELDALAEALLSGETLDQKDAYAAAGLEPPKSQEGDLAQDAQDAAPQGSPISVLA
jgi:cell division protease FtsH